MILLTYCFQIFFMLKITKPFFLLLLGGKKTYIKLTFVWNYNVYFFCVCIYLCTILYVNIFMNIYLDLIYVIYVRITWLSTTLGQWLERWIKFSLVYSFFNVQITGNKIFNSCWFCESKREKVSPALVRNNRKFYRHCETVKAL